MTKHRLKTIPRNRDFWKLNLRSLMTKHMINKEPDNRDYEKINDDKTYDLYIPDNGN